MARFGIPAYGLACAGLPGGRGTGMYLEAAPIQLLTNPRRHFRGNARCHAGRGAVPSCAGSIRHDVFPRGAAASACAGPAAAPSAGGWSRRGSLEGAFRGIVRCGEGTCPILRTQKALR